SIRWLSSKQNLIILASIYTALIRQLSISYSRACNKVCKDDTRALVHKKINPAPQSKPINTHKSSVIIGILPFYNKIIYFTSLNKEGICIFTIVFIRFPHSLLCGITLSKTEVIQVAGQRPGETARLGLLYVTIWSGKKYQP
ncbi:MAG: hypothetical protein LUC45_09445, partial [Paraprevotella sp.]|nr:hypothetical protein [Paraprevotella sp.]